MIGDRTLTIVKGPSCLGANFGLVIEHLRFLASNQTLSPSVKGVNPWLLCEDMTWWVNLWVARALSQAAMRDFRQVSTVEICHIHKIMLSATLDLCSHVHQLQSTFTQLAVT